jgi:glycerol-3-phosphate dehydrogenase
VLFRSTFLLAIPKDNSARRSALEVRLALWLYRRLTGPNISRKNSRPEVERLEHMLNQGRRWALFDYDDAQCEFPERLVAEWLIEAVSAGAVVRNYAEALEVTLRNARVSGVVLRDILTGEEARVSTAHVINASGPWTDQFCRRSGVRTRNPLVGGVRGSHIVLNAVAGMPDAAVYTEALDGRPIFLVPWNGQLLAGTTEVPDTGDPSHTQASNAEINYLMTSVRRLLPHAGIGWQHLRCAFAGVRPLPFSKSKPLGTITRRHILHDHAPEGAVGMISVVGGKLTTAAALARDCARMIGMNPPEPARLMIAAGDAESMDSALDTWAATVAARTGISVTGTRAIAEWHGARALVIARLARSNELLRLPLCDHSHHIAAEAVAAVQNENAVTLADILLRRVPVALGVCWSPECSRIAAERIGRSLHWSPREIGEQLERFEQERLMFLRKPAQIGAETHAA